MSGIFGLYHRDQTPVAHQNLQSMSDILAHRGIDGAHTWVDHNIGLGHRMLWTTPESLSERLPLFERTSGLAITADARIDNREELYSLLEIRQPLADISDSELILAAYAKWGERCPERLLGDFAFAIWDRRNQKLFCARDHFGVKPFYYYVSEKFFAFATEIKALCCLTNVPRRLNESRIADFLTPMDEDRASTFYKDVWRLPASQRLTATGTRFELTQYWSLDPEHEIRLKSDREYSEKLKELFTEAVRCRMRSAFPIGSMLSGGLDSSSISCVARDLLSQKGGSPLHTFSAVFDELTQCDESTFIHEILGQGGFEPHFLHIEEMSPLADLGRILWHVEHAFHASNTHIPWGICAQAGKANVRVLLDGFDGDTTLSHGTGYLYELADKKRWFRLGVEVRAYAQKVTGDSWKKAVWAWLWEYGVSPKVNKVPGLRRLRGVVRDFRGIESANGKATRKRGYNPYRAVLDPTLNAQFIGRMGQAKRLKDLDRGTPKTERAQHHRRLSDPHISSTLEVADRMTAAFPVQVRYPFWDRRLAEFCLALPAEQKLKAGYIRVVMRRAMEGILPAKVQWRTDKSNIYPGFERGLRLFEQERFERLISNEPKIIEDYVDMKSVRAAYGRYMSRTASGSEVTALCRTLVLGEWLQRTGLTP